MSQKGPMMSAVASGFFVLRTPLFPGETIESWTAGLQGPRWLEKIRAEPGREVDGEALAAAVEDDGRILRDRLADVLADPEVYEALLVASPFMVDGLEAWRRDSNSKKGKAAEPSLVRYFLRMASRCTPFGLMAGCSLGTLGAESSLELGPKSGFCRHSRLDMYYVCRLVAALELDADLRGTLRYWPNSSLYQAGGRLRYAEGRWDGDHLEYHLVAVDSDAYLEQVLAQAADGATLGELARRLVSFDPEIDMAEAADFLHQLVDSQLLISEMVPRLTGDEPIHGLIASLEEHPAGRTAAETLRSVRRQLSELDDRGFGTSTETYDEIARQLEGLPGPIELQRLFQVDITKPAPELRLGSAEVAEILRGASVLHHLLGPPDPSAEGILARFSRRFRERYQEGQTVPLVDVLDEELGIGFFRSPEVGAEPNELIRGMEFDPPTSKSSEESWRPQHGMLLGKVAAAITQGEREISLSSEDLESLPVDDLPPMPDTFYALATIASAVDESESVADEGRHEIHLSAVAGPSGARILGRFCHSDPRLREQVEEHLRTEESMRPDAVFAELVHLPDGRPGNILLRPVLRSYEIPFLGRGGAPADRQLPVTDLEVTVSGGRIELSSKRLGCRVEPRLTTAHSVGRANHGLYAFLWSLQMQGIRDRMSWSWGPLATMPFLPRVRVGRCILSRARWRLEGREIRRLFALEGTARFRAVARWMNERGLPRRVLFVDRDKHLIVDFANVLAVNAFLTMVRKYSVVTLEELRPAPEKFVVDGPGGRFAGEIVVPFERRREPEPAIARKERVAPRRVAGFVRSFPPGSEWLFAKLYTGTATADRVLKDLVGPLATKALGEKIASRWFFVRYGDPRWHLRVRFLGRPERLWSDLLPELRARAAPWLEDGRIWSFRLDTYEREVERYGGPDGIELAEILAHHDSESVIRILDLLEYEAGTEVRWRLLLWSMARWLSDLGFETERQIAIFERMSQRYRREFGGGKVLRGQLAQRLRKFRRELEALLEAGPGSDHPLAPGLQLLDERSRRWQSTLESLRRAAWEGRLTRSLEELAPSYLHMSANRILRAAGRPQELVVTDFLSRLLRSRLARSRAR